MKTDLEPIIITRTVGVVNPGDGPESMVATAFLLAGRHINDSMTTGDQQVDLEFTHGEMRFTAACWPVGKVHSSSSDYEED